MALVLSGHGPRQHSDEQRALEDAVKEFQTVLSPEEGRTFGALQAMQSSGSVLEFVADLDFKNKVRGGRGVAQRLHGVLESVQAFSGVVDTFVSSNPEIAALVWGSVKMAMQVSLSPTTSFELQYDTHNVPPPQIAVNYTSYFEKLSELFMSIRKLCSRLVDYRALFPESVRLQRTLCMFHATIIRCCTLALRVLKRSSTYRYRSHKSQDH